ncbi:MAG: SusE domain-containing protein [Janthinobacterium lividum]
MKPWTTKLALGALAFSMISLAACEKDEVRTIIQPGAAPTVTSSAKANIELLQTNSTGNAVTYTWTPVTFGYSTPVTYSLQFDKKGGNFSSPVTFDAGTATTKTLTVADLNSVYQTKGLVSTTTAPVATVVDMRVVASVSAAAPTVTSAVTSVSATPYSFCSQPAAAQAWTIIGPAGVDWNTDVTLQYDCAAKTYTYTGPLKAGAFKFRYGAQWKDGLDLGGTWSSTGASLSQGAPDINVPAAGNYTIVLNPGTVDASNKITGASFTVK